MSYLKFYLSPKVYGEKTEEIAAVLAQRYPDVRICVMENVPSTYKESRLEQVRQYCEFAFPPSTGIQEPIPSTVRPQRKEGE